MKRVLLLILLTTSIKTYGLGIDEKLTLRILKISDSRKTMLINRGVEDGLSVGDHAKFFLTSGVVARGTLIKTSPSRSIWSLYSVSDGEKIRSQAVLNLKITEAVRLTDDKTRMIKDDVIPEGVIVTDKDVEALKKSEMDKDQNVDQPSRYYYQNMDTSENSKGGGRGIFALRSTELFGTFNYYSFSQTEDTGFEGVEATQTDLSELSFSVGMEKYFPDNLTKLRKLSFLGQLDYTSSSSTQSSSSEAPVTTTNTLGVSFGVNWHFNDDPFVFEKLIGFASGSFGLGTITSTTEGSSTSSDTEGSYNDLSFGGGFKYYTEEGVGFRGMLDYYSKTENSTGSSGNEIIKKKSGPRIKAGLSYRF